MNEKEKRENFTNSGPPVFVTSDTGLANNKLLSDEAFLLIQWILFTVMCQIINIFGTGTNIINIICFIKQGFKDSVNVSLLGLAISDLGCLITLIWANISYTPTFSAADLPFDSIDVTYASVGMLYLSFSSVTCWITAFITLERCLCITAPLKVKTIITPTRTLIIIFCFFLILICSSAPVYAVNRLGLKFFPDRNKTMIGLVYNADRETVETISFIINNLFVPFISFGIIITCTITLVFKLRNNNKWRMKSAITGQADNVSSRNQNVAKLVLMISIIFIACFVPVSIIFLAISAEPSFSFEGQNRNVLILVSGLGVFMESINSSVNICVYYRMSSRYRDEFHELFYICKKKSAQHTKGRRKP